MQENPFRRALERFDGGRSWTQGAYHRQTAREGLPFEEALRVPDSERYITEYCSLGALNYPGRTVRGTVQMLAEVIEEQYPPEDRVTISLWNDNPSRTFEEVERVFEKCAIRWDELYG